MAAAIECSPVSPEHYTDSDITGRKFYYHKLQMSNVCDARTDILDTSSWDNDSSQDLEQALVFNRDCLIRQTEYWTLSTESTLIKG